MLRAFARTPKTVVTNAASEMYKDGLPENSEIGTEISRSILFCSSISFSEKASIDEAFMDLTRPVRQILLERYPYLAHVPADALSGLDTPLPPPPQVSWSGLGTIVPIDPAQESKEADDIPSTWHDVALSIAAELMEKARQQISAKLGYTTSAVRFIPLLARCPADLLCRVLHEINF